MVCKQYDINLSINYFYPKQINLSKELNLILPDDRPVKFPPTKYPSVEDVEQDS